MKNLGISKGIWWVSEIIEYKVANKRRSLSEAITISCNNQNIVLVPTDNNEFDFNVDFIADAGNTAQKCGLLPSELLKEVEELRQWKKEQVEAVEPLLQKMKNSKKALTEQRDESLEALSGLLRDFKECISENDLEPQMAGYIGVAEDIIKKGGNMP